MKKLLLVRTVFTVMGLNKHLTILFLTFITPKGVLISITVGANPRLLRLSPVRADNRSSWLWVNS